MRNSLPLGEATSCLQRYNATTFDFCLSPLIALITPGALCRETRPPHWQDETWHEVLRLIAGMIDAEFVGEILDNLMVQNGEEKKFSNIFLAAKCLTEVRTRLKIASIANKITEPAKRLN